MKTFWQLWKEEVPAKDKPDTISHFMKKWKLSKNPTIVRLRQSQFKYLISDLQDLHERLSIAYNLEKGFFIDYSHKAEKEELAGMTETEFYGLSK